MIGEWGKVKALLMINLTTSKTLISRPYLNKKMKTIVKDKAILKLIDSFLDLPIIDSEGKNWATKDKIPNVPAITQTLINILLIEFDRRFKAEMPELLHARYLNEVFLPILPGEEESFPFDRLYDLMDELSLSTHKLLFPGSPPVALYTGLYFNRL